MKAPVARIVVLRLAGRAHVEGGHGGFGAIVRDIADDGVARTAVSAVGERVAEAAVGGIGEIAVAIVASSHVGRNQRKLAGFGDAGADGEGGFAHGGQFGDLHFLNPGERRRILLEGCDESVHGGWVAFHFRHQAGGRVQDVARQSEFLREVVDEGAEANSLNNAAETNANAAPFRAATVRERWPGNHSRTSDGRSRSKNSARRKRSFR